jgi:hypothetical protein
MSLTRFQEAVRSMTGAELSELIGCLAMGADENGITGSLLGVCLAEAVERLREEKAEIRDQGSEIGEETL